MAHKPEGMSTIECVGSSEDRLEVLSNQVAIWTGPSNASFRQYPSG